MSAWPVNPPAPDLSALNQGQQYTDSSSVTPEVFIAMVHMLMYLYWRIEQEVKYGNMAFGSFVDLTYNA